MCCEREKDFPNYTKDEGWPLEAELKHGQASNHLKRLQLRVVVVSVKEKLGLGSRQIRARETNTSEPLDEASILF